jgi:hypothetical protein
MGSGSRVQIHVLSQAIGPPFCRTPTGEPRIRAHPRPGRSGLSRGYANEAKNSRAKSARASCIVLRIPGHAHRPGQIRDPRGGDRDEELGRKTRPREPRIAAFEERWRLKTPGWLSGKKDGRAESQERAHPRKMGTREAKNVAIQERWRLGKLQTGPSRKDDRPDRKKRAGRRKTAAGEENRPSCRVGLLDYGAHGIARVAAARLGRLVAGIIQIRRPIPGAVLSG